MLEIGILGSLDIRVGKCQVVPTAAKPRTVLALLAVHANRFVPVELAASELWGHRPPRNAKAVIQTYILQLRKLLANALDKPSGTRWNADPKQILTTGPCGYVLNSDGESDAECFEKLAEAGHRAREKGDFPTASERFSEALSVWRGRALADVQQGPHLAAELQRLEEMRLNVLDCRIGADLKVGRNHEVLGELTALVSSYPTHEGLCAHLMLALYRSGRRAEALDIYRRLRSNLVGQAGLEPSPAVRRLHASMLAPDRMRQDDVTENWHSATAPALRAGIPAGAVSRIPADVAAAPWVVGDDSPIERAD